LMRIDSETMNSDTNRFLNVPLEAGRIAAKLLLRPSSFFEEMPSEDGNKKAVGFLLLCSLVNAGLTAIYARSAHAAVAGGAFINAFATPFLLASLLYGVTALLCTRVFTFAALMRITAYSSVTLLVAWIPGIGWLGSIWSFFLTGLGMVKAGPIAPGKALAAVAGAVAAFLLLVRMIAAFAA